MVSGRQGSTMKLKTSVVIFQSLNERHQIKIEHWDPSNRYIHTHILNLISRLLQKWQLRADVDLLSTTAQLTYAAIQLFENTERERKLGCIHVRMCPQIRVCV